MICFEVRSYTIRISRKSPILRHVNKLWYFIGFLCATPMSKYLLTSVSVKTTVSYIFSRELTLQVYKTISTIILIMVLPCMVVAHRRILTWSKGLRTVPLVWLMRILTTWFAVELTLSTPRISMLSVKEAIIFLWYWCLKLSMGLRHAPSDRIVMNFDANGYNTRGSVMDLYLLTLR